MFLSSNLSRLLIPAQHHYLYLKRNLADLHLAVVVPLVVVHLAYPFLVVQAACLLAVVSTYPATFGFGIAI
jgi:hypothetical protein